MEIADSVGLRTIGKPLHPRRLNLLTLSLYRIIHCNSMDDGKGIGRRGERRPVPPFPPPHYWLKFCT